MAAWKQDGIIMKGSLSLPFCPCVIIRTKVREG